MSNPSPVASRPAEDREIVRAPAALIDRTADWLMEQALGQTALEDLFRGCCERLLGAGIPLSRAHITFRVLHPLYEAMGMTWLRGSAVESASYVHRRRRASRTIRIQPPLALGPYPAPLSSPAPDGL
jgi:hypothetical protein